MSSLLDGIFEKDENDITNLDIVNEPETVKKKDSKEAVYKQSTGIQSLRIQNVQSIRDLTLTFDEKGVYRIDGNNDVGKSAVLRAINALFHNVSRNSYKEFISDWATTFVVEAWFYDGGYVKLSRGADDYYEWDTPLGSDSVYKTDGQVPEELKAYFNMYTETEKSKRSLNVNLQGDSLPFVDTSSSDNFWLIQKTLGTNVLLNSVKILKDEIKEFSKENKNLEKYIAEETEKILLISNEIENDKLSVAEIDKVVSVLEEEYQDFLSLKKYRDDLKEKDVTLQSFKDIKILSDLELLELKKVLSKYQDIVKYNNMLKDILSTNNLLNTVNHTLSDLDLDSLSSKVLRQENLNKYNSLYKELENSKNNLEKTNYLLDNVYINDCEVLEIAEKIDGLKILKEYAENKKEILFKKELLQNNFLDEFPDDLSNFVLEKQAIIKDLEKYKLLKNEVLLSKQGLPQVCLKIDQIALEIKELREEEKVCPVCGSDLAVVHTH